MTTIDFLEIKNVIKVMYSADVPLFLWGPPGIGKSTVVKNVFNEVGVKVYDVRLSQYEAVDLRGVPVPDKQNEVTKWYPPSTLPFKNSSSTDGEGACVLFLDEIMHASPSVQSAAFQLILERRVGEHVLKENTYIIAASNRDEDRAGINRLLAPLANRFAHVEVRVSFDSWKEWACNPINNIHPMVVGYLSQRPSHLLLEEAIKQGHKSFPTPRTWEYVSRALFKVETQGMPLEVARTCVEALIGVPVASEFVVRLQNAAHCPQWEEIITTPETAKVPKEIDALYATTYMCVLRTEKNNTKEVTKYIKRLPMEYQTLYISDISRARTKFVASDEQLRNMAAHILKEVL